MIWYNSFILVPPVCNIDGALRWRFNGQHIDRDLYLLLFLFSLSRFRSGMIRIKGGSLKDHLFIFLIYNQHGYSIQRNEWLVRIIFKPIHKWKKRSIAISSALTKYQHVLEVMNITDDNALTWRKHLLEVIYMIASTDLYLLT